MGQRKRFSPEFKREAVQLLESGSRPASEIARELGIARNRLYKWQADLKARGGRLRFVVLSELGQPRILDDPDPALLVAAYSEVAAGYEGAPR